MKKQAHVFVIGKSDVEKTLLIRKCEEVLEHQFDVNPLVIFTSPFDFEKLTVSNNSSIPDCVAKISERAAKLDPGVRKVCWLCIDNGSNRVEDGDRQLITELAPNFPLIVALGNVDRCAIDSSLLPDIEALCEHVQHVVPYLPEEKDLYRDGTTPPCEAFGIDDLVAATLSATQKIPQLTFDGVHFLNTIRGPVGQNKFYLPARVKNGATSIWLKWTPATKTWQWTTADKSVDPNWRDTSDIPNKLHIFTKNILRILEVLKPDPLNYDVYQAKTLCNEIPRLLKKPQRARAVQPNVPQEQEAIVNLSEAGVHPHFDEAANQFVFNANGPSDALVASTSASRVLDHLSRRCLRAWRPPRPVGITIYGEPGSGKTEMVRRFADTLYEHLRTAYGAKFPSNVSPDVFCRYFNCVGMVTKENVNQLLGCPPGVEGSQHAGALVSAIRSGCHILVLDEVDKAHGDVPKALGGVIDEGWLCDNSQETAKCGEYLANAGINAPTFIFCLMNFGDDSKKAKEEADKLTSAKNVHQLDNILAQYPLTEATQQFPEMAKALTTIRHDVYKGSKEFLGNRQYAALLSYRSPKALYGYTLTHKFLTEAAKSLPKTRHLCWTPAALMKLKKTYFPKQGKPTTGPTNREIRTAIVELVSDLWMSAEEEEEANAMIINVGPNSPIARERVGHWLCVLDVDEHKNIILEKHEIADPTPMHNSAHIGWPDAQPADRSNVPVQRSPPPLDGLFSMFLVILFAMASTLFQYVVLPSLSHKKV